MSIVIGKILILTMKNVTQNKQYATARLTDIEGSAQELADNAVIILLNDDCTNARFLKRREDKEGGQALDE